MTRRLHLPDGTAGADGFRLAVTPQDAGWTYSSLRVLDLAPGASRTLDTGASELIVLPLSGSCRVEIDGTSFGLDGRADVFSRVTDFAYAPRDARVTVHSTDGGRFALPAARCERRLAPAYGPAEAVPVEIRGAGPATRQVNNFASPEGFPCDRLVAVEVLTPGGNWSSYPPHKHDERRPGEAVLEEIYYFEIGGPGPHGLGYQRVYEPAAAGGDGVDVLAEVRQGDVVLVPRGYHGPSMAAPGHPLYYLNVLAGPDPQRTMACCDDPAHHWVRASWDGRAADPRVPICDAGGPR
ncbi:5-deoxy-glucuronate isomerase [Streptomyces nodosus]|uniref:5-deoxy-glucuronate isomerase n=1 Tax=Streptomyces nodosus TaxID=40318 RepID=A0A0B5DF53_9ACTN|nr:5-deoxy-glucuronate isomerase [Streptomyces nodosus]AJE39091.1 5-deoxyglucuronate isomerase [Streptomyces nodosus]MBB4789960.1 5-deoxy-glucuronate isomerase [Streptomyces nodosus]QEV37684.1 5-deoxy-glucuronate isomerase [Streptomyces nodosus]